MIFINNYREVLESINKIQNSIYFVTVLTGIQYQRCLLDNIFIHSLLWWVYK